MGKINLIRKNVGSCYCKIKNKEVQLYQMFHPICNTPVGKKICSENICNNKDCIYSQLPKDE